MKPHQEPQYPEHQMVPVPRTSPTFSPSPDVFTILTLHKKPSRSYQASYTLFPTTQIVSAAILTTRQETIRFSSLMYEFPPSEINCNWNIAGIDRLWNTNIRNSRSQKRTCQRRAQSVLSQNIKSCRNHPNAAF